MLYAFIILYYFGFSGPHTYIVKKQESLFFSQHLDTFTKKGPNKYVLHYERFKDQKVEAENACMILYVI
jgi:hypothetical protein